VRRRGDIEPDDIVELVGKPGVIRQLELPVAMRLQAVRFQDAAHRAGADLAGAGHHDGRPVRRLARRIGQRQCHHALDHVRFQGRDARRPGLVAQQAIRAGRHETFLPAPDTGLRLTSVWHDRRRPDAIGRQQDDPGPPDMLLCRVAILDHLLKPKTVRR